MNCWEEIFFFHGYIYILPILLLRDLNTSLKGKRELLPSEEIGNFAGEEFFVVSGGTMARSDFDH